MQDKPWNKHWTKRFKKDATNSHKRFKKLSIGYPKFDIDKEIIDTVEFDEFIRIEKQRIPLFIGSQFGIYPRLNDMPNFFNGDKAFAILSKSLISGNVSGLSLYEYKLEKNKYYKIHHYENS